MSKTINPPYPQTSLPRQSLPNALLAWRQDDPNDRCQWRSSDVLEISKVFKGLRTKETYPYGFTPLKTTNQKIWVLKMFFLFNWVFFRFHVSFLGEYMEKFTHLSNFLWKGSVKFSEMLTQSVVPGSIVQEGSSQRALVLWSSYQSNAETGLQKHVNALL